MDINYIVDEKIVAAILDAMAVTNYYFNIL
jgi:hypothetical protein